MGSIWSLFLIACGEQLPLLASKFHPALMYRLSRLAVRCFFILRAPCLSHTLSQISAQLPQILCKFPSPVPLIPGTGCDSTALQTAEDGALRSRSLDQYSSGRAKNACLTSCHFSSLSDSISNATFILPNASSSRDNNDEGSL